MARSRALAIVLAGGQGSRMDVLTRERAKPALPFAGVYQLVDFPMSNLSNSGIDDVWLVLQYQPQSVDTVVANGRPWDLDRTIGGLRLIMPAEGTGTVDEEGFATGNADQLYRMRDQITARDPDVLVVLSSDHVYRFDFGEAIATHRGAGAECTVVTTEVSRAEAREHAVVQVDRDGRVTGMQDKPEQAETGVIATEIFVYEPRVLVEALEELYRRSVEDAPVGDTGLGDFGSLLLPHLIERGKVFAHALPGYWRDVGRPSMYLSAHRDLLSGQAALFDDPDWPIRSKMVDHPPARVRQSASVADSLLSPGCEIAGQVRGSVIGPRVLVEQGASVTDSVVFPDTVIRSGAQVQGAILDSDVSIEADARVGGRLPEGKPETQDITLVGRGSVVGAGVRLPRGSRLEPGTTA